MRSIAETDCERLIWRRLLNSRWIIRLKRKAFIFDWFIFLTQLHIWIFIIPTISVSSFICYSVIYDYLRCINYLSIYLSVILFVCVSEAFVNVHISYEKLSDYRLKWKTQIPVMYMFCYNIGQFFNTRRLPLLIMEYWLAGD